MLSLNCSASHENWSFCHSLEFRLKKAHCYLCLPEFVLILWNSVCSTEDVNVWKVSVWDLNSNKKNLKWDISSVKSRQLPKCMGCVTLEMWCVGISADEANVKSICLRIRLMESELVPVFGIWESQIASLTEKWVVLCNRKHFRHTEVTGNMIVKPQNNKKWPLQV